MTPRSIRRAAERKARKQARKEALLESVKPAADGQVSCSTSPAVFEEHVQAYFDEYKPQGLRERELVQSLAETRWRLNRSFAIEAALFSQPVADTEPGAPPPGDFQNLIKYERALKNLHLQEARLNRRFEKDLAELWELQQARIREELLGTNATSPAGTLDPEVASNLQMLKAALAHESSTLRGSPEQSDGWAPARSESAGG